jgi:CheY-like chemotaxis protein
MAKEILVANSEQSDREELQKIFNIAQYHLTFCERDEDPLLRIKLFKPDLIIAGTGPGEVSSLELCESVKTDPEAGQIPFIIISTAFSEVTEKNRKRVKADGVISKPFREDEIMSVVDRLVGEGTLMEKGRNMMEKDLDWKSIPGIEKPVSKKEELALDVFGGGDEEIIDLVEVEEEGEAEPRMRINDFIGLGKEESIGEISPLETWAKPGEEKFGGKDAFVFPEEKELKGEEIMPPLGKAATVKAAAPPKPVAPSKPTPRDDDLFEKIDMEDILQEVEKLKPSLEKEWPVEEKETSLKETSVGQKVDELFAGFDDFETALRKEVKAEAPIGELEPAFVHLPKEEAKEEIPEVVASEEIAIEEEIEEEIEELSDEEFPTDLLEKLGEEEISAVEEPKKVVLEEVGLEEVTAEPEAETIEKIEEVRPAPKVEKPPEVESPRISVQGVSKPAKTFDKQMEKALAKGMQEMMGEVINKFVPEMTHHIMQLTFERIEKMVKEVLPDLAEKAIEEEIKRLQKDEKS